MNLNWSQPANDFSPQLDTGHQTTKMPLIPLKAGRKQVKYRIWETKNQNREGHSPQNRHRGGSSRTRSACATPRPFRHWLPLLPQISPKIQLFSRLLRSNLYQNMKDKEEDEEAEIGAASASDRSRRSTTDEGWGLNHHPMLSSIQWTQRNLLFSFLSLLIQRARKL